MKLLRIWNGVFLTLLLVAFIEYSRATGRPPPIPFLLLYTSVVYTAYVGGLLAGLVSAGVASGFIVYCALISFGPGTLTGGPVQVALGAGLHILTALLIGRTTNLKQRLVWELHQNKITLEEQVFKRTEKLAESEERFRTVVDNMPAAFLLKDIRGGYLVANKVWHKWFNPEDKDIVGKTVFQFYPRDHAEEITDQDRQVLELGKPVESEMHTPFNDGRKRTTFLQKFPIFDDDGQVTAIGGINTDITNRKRAEVALRESEGRYRRAASLTKMGHWLWDEIEDKCIYCSEEMANIYGVSVEEYLRKSVSLETDLQWFHPDDRQHCESVIMGAFRNKTGYEITARIIRGDGEIRYIHEVADSILDTEGNLIQSAGVLHDITERKQAEQALSFQATHDALTGLINRGELERRLLRILDTTHTSQDEHALCYLDLDQFKIVNDTCGHAAGDELLHQLGQLLLTTVRKRDSLARLGGDEFGVLMEHCSLGQARRVANNIRKAVSEFRFAWDKQIFHIGVSIGLVPISENSESVANLLSAADSACYMAKEDGRNRVHVYHLDDTELARRHGEMQWVGRIKQALEDNRFELWSQAIVPLQSVLYEGEHFELLLRLVDEQGEIVPPGAFLPAAERYGLATELDRWVIDAALDCLGGKPKLLEQLHLCCINLSGTSLANEEFLEFVQEKLKQFQVPAHKICFEVTETAAIANLSRAMIFMQALKSQGCRFALDDFGSGLSSFAYLKTLPVDYLKIDGGFVKDIVDDDVDLAMVRSINDVGQVMDKITIAEFVESPAILAKLREIGVNYAQGYHIGRPIPIRETALFNASDFE